MKHYLSLLLTLLVTIPLLAMEYHYQVPTPLVSPDGQVTAAGMFTGGQPGAPAVPVFPVRILLPPGSAASQVTIDYGQRMDLGVVLLPPVQQQWPFSLSEQATITRRDSLVWAQPYDLPLTELDHISTQQLAGYSILYVETHPVRYNPLTRRLSFYRDFDLRVETIPAECRFTPVAAARSRVSGLVDNPEDLLAYVVPATRTEAYDYLIVTSNELQEDFQPLADWRNSIGIRTRIVTIEDIVPFWDGVDNAARLRNFLINEYQQWGIKYLLLAGDTDQLPYRRLYVLAGSTEDHLPSDLYFAGLDGTWNNDGDDRWGEPGEEDWLQEIVVGRASVSNSSEATNFVNKQLGYQQAPVVADLLAYLMVGENLDEVPTWGGDCKDEIRYGSTLHGITTAGLAPQINSSLLYDRESYWSTSDLFERLSQGINLTNHLGHSNHSYMMRMNLDDVNTINLTADGISHNFHVGYSQGCIPGAFEENDCIIEELTNLPTGYAAFIGNSRYGWYQPGGTGGSSQLFDREFFDAIFGEEIGTLGEALQDSRDDLISQTMNDGHMRWVFYELNLFGDPAMYAWTLEPQVIAAQYNDSLEVGSTTLAVEVTSGGQPGRGMLAAVVSDGVYYGGGTTDNSGQLLIEFTAPLVQIGEYELVISGWNCLPASLPLVVAPAQGPFLILTDSEFTDSAGNGNGLPEAGEELELTISLANAGIEVASGVNALLSCASEYIEVSLPAVTLPDIPSGGEMTAAVPFQLVAAASTPDLLEVECVLTIWCDGGAWTESIPLALHAPQVTIIEMTADPDGNGILDPGETTWLEMTLINTGSGWVTDLAALLETVDDCITFVQAADNMDELMPGSTGELAFQLTTAEDTEPGHTVAFSLLLTGQPGLELTLDFLLVVGQHLEGFETGDFSTCDWTPGGDAPWTIVEEDPAAGTYCARSGGIDHNQASTLSCSQFVPLAGTISFQYRVSSQTGGDRLSFLIDGELLDQWSGEADWGEALFEVPVGWHTFSWSYHKNSYGSNGADCGWIDSILFPPSADPQPPTLELEPTQLVAYVENGGSADEQLLLRNGGDLPLQYNLSFLATPERDFSDDMENGTNGWTQSGDGSPWHLTSHRNYSPTHSWYVGVEGEWQYEDEQYARLVTPVFFIANDSQLNFQHWGSMEAEGAVAHDGAVVEISVSGGDWQRLQPAGGYPCQVGEEVDTPFPAGTPCFSGDWDWTETSFDLSPWAGSSIQIGFLFAADQGTTAEGWYIDDLQVMGTAPGWISYQPGSGVLAAGAEANVYFHLDGDGYADTVLSGVIVIQSNDPVNNERQLPVYFQVGLEQVEEEQPLTFRLEQNHPNPFNPATSIVFCLARSEEVSLEVYDLQGRLMRQLLTGVQPAGEQEIIFHAGELSAGVYFYRLETESFSTTRKMLLVK